MSSLDSLQLRHLYTREYYLYGVAGHEAFRQGEGGIAAVVNLARAHALASALAPPLLRVTDIGAGRGELAKHLVQQAVTVTLVDYSPAAMRIARGFLGENGSARFLTICATDVGRYLEPSSQDAIFMCDFAEHVNRDELRRVLHECARALTPDGVLCIHTPERTSGAVMSRRAVEERHINLMDIGDLHELLGEVFGFSDAYTWNGTQAFVHPGRCIDLFGVARPGRPPTRVELPAAPDGTYRLRAEHALDTGFMLRCEVRPEGSERVRGRLRFLDARRRPIAECPFELEAHDGEPCVLHAASRLLGGADDVAWRDVDRVVVALEDGSALARPPAMISGRASGS